MNCVRLFDRALESFDLINLWPAVKLDTCDFSSLLLADLCSKKVAYQGLKVLHLLPIELSAIVGCT